MPDSPKSVDVEAVSDPGLDVIDPKEVDTSPADGPTLALPDEKVDNAAATEAFAVEQGTPTTAEERERRLALARSFLKEIEESKNGTADEGETTSDSSSSGTA